MSRISFGVKSNDGKSEDVPFLKEYCTNLPRNYRFGENDHPVGRIYRNDKGLLLFTAEFKLFLFARSKLSQQLVEAVEAWVSGTPANGYLYVMPTTIRGTMDIGLETEVKPEKWSKEETTNMYNEPRIIYQQYLPEKEMRALNRTPVRPTDNPFLALNNPSPTIGYESTGEQPKSKRLPKDR